MLLGTWEQEPSGRLWPTRITYIYMLHEPLLAGLLVGTAPYRIHILFVSDKRGFVVFYAFLSYATWDLPCTAGLR